MEVECALRKVFYAPCLAEALEAVKTFAAKHGKRFPTPCGIMARNVGDYPMFHRFPKFRWKRQQMINLIERASRKAQRRTNVVGRFPAEMAALTLIWSRTCGIEQDRLKWRGVQLAKDILEAVAETREEGAFQEVAL